jgi:predicted peptidase
MNAKLNRVSIKLRWNGVLVFCAMIITTTSYAATTIKLPEASCSTDISLLSGFENPDAPTPASDVSRTIEVPGFGTKTYYLHLPTNYSRVREWPVLWVLHGAAGSSSLANNYAQIVRSNWSELADEQGFIVVAPVANGALGGWGTTADIPMLTAIGEDLEANYRTEHMRYYLWGFSAGGHYAHALALDNSDTFAAYAVNAGSLLSYACTTDETGPLSCPTYLASIVRKVPVAVRIGVTDPLYPEASADPARLSAAGWDIGDINYLEFSGGHTYEVAQFPGIWNHLCRYAVIE